MSLTLRNVEVDGRRGLDVRIEDGRIAAIGVATPGRGPEIDGEGGALIPGLADHHLHLLATAAQADSLDLDDVRSAPDLAARLRRFADARPQGVWLRATGYHEGAAGLIGREHLDRLAPRHPLRVQHRSGSLWVLNSAALARVLGDEAPACVERDSQGRATGRIWRGDAWLHGRIGRRPPPLAPLGANLSRLGVTALTDASASTDAGAAALLADAVRAGDLPQRLTLMSAGALAAPADGAFAVGPVKILLDDRDLPSLEAMRERIAAARAQGRAVAVHCVTDAELALTLAAFAAAGGRAGDRIEHGGVIPADAIAAMAALRLTVVTQPAFVRERGDRYLVDVPKAEHADLYRCASLIAAGIPVAASSDAPYGGLDPWAGMRAARDRRTHAGLPLGAAERVSAETALRMLLGPPASPGGPARRVRLGARADLVLLAAPLREALDVLTADLVRVTLIAGRVAFETGLPPGPTVG